MYPDFYKSKQKGEKNRKSECKQSFVQVQDPHLQIDCTNVMAKVEKHFLMDMEPEILK